MSRQAVGTVEVAHSHDDHARLSVVELYAGMLPIPLAAVCLSRQQAYMVASALIQAVGTTDLLDEQLAAGRAEVLAEVRMALQWEAAVEHPEFPAEFVAGLNAGINTAIQRVDALRRTPAAPEEQS